MSKLNKIISCLIPIATIGALAPVMFGCSKPALTLKFGDKINCLYTDKEHTDVVVYHSHNDVANAVKMNTDIQTEETTVYIDDLNSQRSFEMRFWDLLAGVLFLDESKNDVYCECELSAAHDSFETCKLYKGKCGEESIETIFNGETFGKSQLEYAQQSGSNKVFLKVDSNFYPSYTYQHCTIG